MAINGQYLRDPALAQKSAVFCSTMIRQLMMEPCSLPRFMPGAASMVGCAQIIFFLTIDLIQI